MKTRSLFILLLALTFSVGAFAREPKFQMPSDWHAGNNTDKHYDIGLDPTGGPDSKSAATILFVEDSTIVDKPNLGSGSLIQMCLPDKYRGKRVRMTAMLKSSKVENWAGMWFRVDGPNRKKNSLAGSLAFDNMQNRPVTGTTDWKTYTIVLDIPNGAARLAYGALLAGRGQIWFRNLTFEIVDQSVPSTDMITGQSTLKEPSNLDFK